MAKRRPGTYRIGNLKSGNVTGRVVGRVYNTSGGVGVPRTQPPVSVLRTQSPARSPPPTGPGPEVSHSGALPTGTYRVGNLTVNIDSAGRITGDWTGRVDAEGRVIDPSGKIVGQVYNTGGGVGIPTFRDTSGQTAVIHKIEPPARMPPPTGPGPEVSHSGALPPGTYRVGNLTINVDSAGRITGDWTGFVDGVGRVYDANGVQVGTVVAGEFRPHATPEQRVPINRLDGVSPRGGGAVPGQPGQPGKPGQNVLTGVSSEELQETVSFLKGLLKETTQQFLDARDEVNALARLISGEAPRLHQISRDLETFTRGAVEHFADILHRGPTSARGLVASYIANIPEMRQAFLDAARRVGEQIVPALSRSLQALEAPITNYGAFADLARLRENLFPDYKRRVDRFIETLSEQANLATALSRSLTREAQDILSGRPIPITQEYEQRIRNFINTLSSQAGIAAGAASNFLAQASNILAGRRPGIIADYEARIEDLANRLISQSDIARDASRKLAALLSDILADRAPAITQEYEQRIRNLIGNLTGPLNTAIGLSGDLATKVRDVLSGRITLPEFIRQDLEQRELARREELMRELGPGYATSTPGQIALREFERFRQGVLDQYRTEELQRALAGLASQQQTVQGLGGIIGQQELTIPQLRLETLSRALSGLESQSQAFHGLIGTAGQQLSTIPNFRLEALSRALAGAEAQQRAFQGMMGLAGQQELTIPQLRLDTLSRTLAGLESQSQAVQGLMSTAGQQALTVPTLGSQIAALASELEQARERALLGRTQATSALAEALSRAEAARAGLIQEASAPYIRALGLQEALRNMFGATMSDVLSGARDVMSVASQAAAYQALPISLRTGLASDVISALGRAAFLPMQARATALGLLNAAMGGSNVNLGGLMAAIPQTMSPGISPAIAQLVAQLGAQRGQGLAAALGAASGGLMGLASNLALASAYGGMGGSNWGDLLRILGGSGGTTQITSSLASALQNSIPRNMFASAVP